MDGRRYLKRDQSVRHVKFQSHLLYFLIIQYVYRKDYPVREEACRRVIELGAV